MEGERVSPVFTYLFILFTSVFNSEVFLIWILSFVNRLCKRRGGEEISGDGVVGYDVVDAAVEAAEDGTAIEVAKHEQASRRGDGGGGGDGSGGKGRATTRSAGQIVKTSKGGKGKFGGKNNSSDRNSRKGNSNTRNVFHIQVSEDGDATGSADDGPIWYDAPKGDYHDASLTEENVTNVTLEEADPSPGEWITPTKKTAKKV